MMVQTYVEASEAKKDMSTNNKYGPEKFHLLIFPYLHFSRKTIMCTDERQFQTYFTRVFHAV